MKPTLSYRLIAGLALVFTAAVSSADDEDPRAWLTEMADAFNTLAYDGVFTYYSGSQLASLRIVHKVIDGVQHERLIHQNGPPREIVRRGEEVVCILRPEDDLVSLEPELPSGPFARAFIRRFDRLSDYYDISFVGEDRVADREAMRIAISPRDEHRFGYRLWLDRETRLLLRSELVDAEGTPLEIFLFNTLKTGDAVDSAALEPSAQDERAKISSFVLDAEPTLPVNEGERWRPEWLPDGFVLSSSQTRRKLKGNKLVHTLMYTDGLAAFSVFIEDMPPEGAADMVSRNGATVAVTQLTTGPDDKPYLITLVGELPTETARRIARSIRPL